MFTVLCWLAHSDWQHTEEVLYVIGKSNTVLCKHKQSLTLKEKTITNMFTNIYIVEIPTQKENENVQSCPSNEKITFELADMEMVTSLYIVV